MRVVSKMPKQQKSMQELWQDSYLTSGSEEYLEDLYEAYLSDPKSVAPEWKSFFNDLTKKSKTPDVSHAAIRDYFLNLPKQAPQTMVEKGGEEIRIFELINNYRRVGHLQAEIDPLQLMQRKGDPSLALSYYGFVANDDSKSFAISQYAPIKSDTATLNEIHDSLKKTYCRTIGFEYMHIDNADEVQWIRNRIENEWSNYQLSADTKKHILDRLVVADGMEKYLGFKYVGQKRFSLEGGDSLIPALDAIIDRAASQGVKETAIGMAHRGRLNVLVNVVGKSPKEVFAGFEGTTATEERSGDVKYHIGYSADVKTPSGDMHIALAFNPSHLEIVAPVVQGAVRARQRRRGDKEAQQVLPIQIHGDAAFAGQGVVMETFSMSQTRWFKVGGSIHIVINNQVGFTTSNPQDSRSTTYCTDIAKMVAAPILHVNGNDPEAVYFAALFAIDFRHQFKKDVVIDLVCYRRQGHNEADEPSATQPVMYKTIKAMPVPYQLYADRLQKEGVIDELYAKKLVDDYRAAMDAGQTVVTHADATAELLANWQPFLGHSWKENVNTAVPSAKLRELGKELAHLPDGFVVQPQVKKTLENQKKMADGEMPLNWGYAEILAYASLLDTGHPIRLCGQDAGRGTFAHRHAVLHEQNTDEVYIPLSHLSANQAQINIVDSLLSEEAVLGFEYGYASAEPNNLVIWEAQFGDFANGAQVVMDQFISSSEQKWGMLCGLVMLLPHGYEGQGPEHSSARLERYLQLCAEDNMQVCVPTTPSQIFHLLRRQILRPYRKPLIVMSPKSLLRHPQATSRLKDLTDGAFETVIADVDKQAPAAIERVVLCSGKVYYDLIEQRRANNLSNTAIIRIEQLYPFPTDKCKEILSTYSNAKRIIWCQEEPQNQGAWSFIQPYLREISGNATLSYAGRAAAAAPAVGYLSIHEKQQKELVAQALLK